MVKVFLGLVMAACFTPTPGPASARQDPLELCALLEARDAALGHVQWAFEVKRKYKLSEGEEEAASGILWWSGENRRLELEDRTSGVERISTWNGRLLTVGSKPLDSEAELVFDQAAERRSAFKRGTFPDNFGLRIAGKSVHSLLCADYTVERWGEEVVNGTDCTVFLVHAGGSPFFRLYLDVDETLLCWRTETLMPAESGGAVGSDQEGVPRTKARPRIRWDLVRAEQVAGIWLPAEGRLTSPGIEDTPQEYCRVVVDHSRTMLGGAFSSDLFVQELETGAHLRNLETGRVKLVGTKNVEGVSRERLEQLARYVLGEGEEESVSNGEDSDNQWLDASCAFVASYLMMRVSDPRRPSVELLRASEEIFPLGSEGPGSLEEVGKALKHAGHEVYYYEVDPGFLSGLDGHVVAHLGGADGEVGHFVLATGGGPRGVRITDSHRGTVTIPVKEFHRHTTGRVRIVSAKPLSADGGGFAYIKYSLFVCAAILVIIALLWGGRGGQRVAALLAISMAFLSTACSRAQDQEVLTVMGASVHDAGVVKFGAEIQHIFRLKNNTGEPLSLDGVQSTCGCTSVRVSPERIEPRQTAELQVTVTADSVFRSSAKIHVFSSDYPGRRLAALEVNLSTDGSERILVTPGSLMLQRDEEGGRLQAHASVRCLHHEGYEPVLSVNAPEWLQWELAGRGSERYGAGKMETQYELMLRAAPGHVLSPRLVEDVVVSDKAGRLYPCMLKVSAAGRAGFSTHPSRIFFGTQVKGRVARYLDLSRIDSAAEIVSVKCALPWVHCSVDVAESGGEARVEVVVDAEAALAAGQSDAFFSGEVIVKCGPGSETITIPLNGRFSL